MEIRYKLFPHPVLWEKTDDYINSEFSSIVEIKREIRSIKLQVGFKLKNKELEKMLSEEKIEYVIHIECPRTSYRKIIATSDKLVVETIKDENILGKIQISTFIVAKQELINYSNLNFNQDYFGIKFNLQKGTILAIGNQYRLEVEKEKEELGTIPSIFTICKRETEEEIGMGIEYNSEKIKISLNKSDYENYNQLVLNTSKNRDSINIGIIFPALIYVLEHLKLEFEEIENNDYRWFRALKHIFKNYNYELTKETLEEDSIVLAQKLLSYPLGRALSALRQEDNEGEEE
ncbi:hypothetical protein [Fusobacterium perfoetens]|uniref:hypothetical protein n=1 Tax=Fusobacterium perfoetens TaxID=852 RepID=UPI00048450D9|nr:hypothetical protein [Fusobacterium perfoetens]